jgi:hypothetical protein
LYNNYEETEISLYNVGYGRLEGGAQMIRTLTAYSLEPDDVDTAVNDILRQLNPAENLLKNSAGLLFCYVDFIRTGMVKALCDRLPFDVIGCTTQGIATADAADEVMLALMVLTSDTVQFATGFSEPIETDIENRIYRLYERTSASSPGQPSLMFVFQPLLPGFTGDLAINILDRLACGAPLFGSVAFDVDTKVRSPMTIHNGAASLNRLALMLLYGDIAPNFFLDSIPERIISNQKAVITAASGNRLIGLDNMSAAAYMEKTGLLSANNLVQSLFAFPLLVDPHDGSKPKPLTSYDVGQDGSLICSAPVPAGATLNICFPTSDLVLGTAVDITAAVRKQNSVSGLLMFSCVSRSVMLPDPKIEMETIQEQLRGFPAPYLFVYSGGEICPRRGKNGEMHNGFHLYIISACTL